MASILGNPNTQVKKTGYLFAGTVPNAATVVQLLAANGVFNTPWIDTQETGGCYVSATTLSAQASASNGFLIQESDDQVNTRAPGVQLAAAGVVAVCQANIRRRFWRIQYTNGAIAQTSFTLTATELNVAIIGDGTGTMTNGTAGNPDSEPINSGGGTANTFADNVANQSGSWILNGVGTGGSQRVVALVFGGGFSGTANAALSGFSRPATPTVFKQVSTAATGSTALWTPGSNNKFRLLKYAIEVTSNVVAAAAAVLVIKLLDAAADIGQDHSIFIPSAAATTFATPWGIVIDLGQFGIKSAAANNVLNLNLSFALTGGVVNVLAMGTEE